MLFSNIQIEIFLIFKFHSMLNYTLSILEIKFISKSTVSKPINL